MNIACIGNMNNASFCLTRYLRDAGYNAQLLTFADEPDHFSPVADSYTDEYKSFTKFLPWRSKPTTFYKTSKREILDVLKGFDILIASGASGAYISKAGRQVHLFIPYGSDIHTIPHINILRAPLKKMYRNYLLRKHQRSSIKHAGVVSLERTNEEFETQFVKPLKLNGLRLDVTSPFIYYPQYENGEMQQYASKCALYEQFKQIRERHDLVIFQHSRQEWTENESLVVVPHVWTKGNNKLLNGFATFCRAYPSTKPALILFEYGTSVEQSRSLIKRLGIEKNVFWFPKSYRKDIMLGISLADIGVGELGISWYTYGTMLEFMALKKPVMHFRDDSLYVNKELYPMIYASDEEAVLNGLISLTKQRQAVDSIGLEGNKWFKKYCVEKPLGEYEKIISKATLKSNYH